MLKNRADADDATQEVFIRIWKNFEKTNIKFEKAWVLKITHNVCLDYLSKRKISNGREVELKENLTESSVGDYSYSNPEILERKNFLKEKIKEAIENLPENLKSVFVLYELQGFKYKEISEVLDLPLNTVKVYILRARKKLQEELRKYHQ